MKILIYDPLYSRVGHFYRYNLFLAELMNSIDSITEITVLTEDEELKSLEGKLEKVRVVYRPSTTGSMQEKSIKAKGLSKISLLLESYRNYKKTIRFINQSDCDLVFFASNGQLSFWLSARALRKKYMVSAISIKWFYRNGLKDHPLYNIYRRFLAKASKVFFTEEMYAKHAEKIGITRTAVFPDRFLTKDGNLARSASSDQISLVTVGTISTLKNPVSFIRSWDNVQPELVKKFSYGIYGKIMDGIGNELNSVAAVSQVSIKLVNDYVSSAFYNELMAGSDFVVIPYPEEYTRYATSGVMWDCFQMQKPIICPDIEPFRYYINKYGVGYLYSDKNLESTLQKIIAERQEFQSTLDQRFLRLIGENSFAQLKQRLQHELGLLQKNAV